ncbi:outer membrane protein assembly factor BamB family protein [Siphonobacter aquaeclarae]|uniref:Quinoprotein glucose dehydrogenase n=1 Tax=Siphonobacter aquaeclarae TaxID=563176 RepID=A0A1G9XL02_9BACT|nr:PQQ-binding-like beta-propeller repeat protein [Siphonobacter aquaeclarae]SDM97529.1 quinoprotein glucose dehydrogenase [Siphonobacter aquaeclarae]
MKYIFLLAGACALSLIRPSGGAPPGMPQDGGTTDWPAYGGNNAGNRYSPLAEIHTGNVSQLKLAWKYFAAEGERPLEIQCQPIILDGILYGTTPMLKLFAVRADTGEPLWKFDPFVSKPPRYHANRGLMYWKEGKRIFYTAGMWLYCIDPATGLPNTSFGDNGAVDLRIGLEDLPGREISRLAVDATSPGVIYRNTLVIGSRVGEFGDAAPGYIRGIDTRTGKLKWVFHTIPHPGEFGYETWPKDAWKFIGGANNWSGMVLDEKRGMVYFGTGSPSVDFYGGARAGINLFSDCIMALDAETGKRKWHYQTVHHDLWDRDLPCPPNLTTVTHKGKKVDVVVQTTKDGLVYVLNRDTGVSLFPVEERAVPTEGLPGEKPWPKQRVPLKPAPFSRQVFTEADITDLSPEAHTFVKNRFDQTRSGNKFMPPSKEGTLVLGLGGGAEWGGNAIDPSGILYQNANEMVWDLKMSDFKGRGDQASAGRSLYMSNCAVCHGADRKGSGQEYPSLLAIGEKRTRDELLTLLKSGKGRMPAFGHLTEDNRRAIVSFLLNLEQKPAGDAQHSTASAPAAPAKGQFPYIPPYINNGWTRFHDPQGYPAIKPPWGTLNAIDLNTGEYLWKVPLGEFPELTKKGVPVTGTENYGGPIVTAGNLVFIAATKDERFRAFDRRTGKVVWEYQLPAGGFATPATYQVNGKQYIVLAVGGAKNGHKPGGYYMAFSL